MLIIIKFLVEGLAFVIDSGPEFECLCCFVVFFPVAFCMTGVPGLFFNLVYELTHTLIVFAIVDDTGIKGSEFVVFVDGGSEEEFENIKATSLEVGVCFFYSVGFILFVCPMPRQVVKGSIDFEERFLGKFIFGFGGRVENFDIVVIEMEEILDGLWLHLLSFQYLVHDLFDLGMGFGPVPHYVATADRWIA